MPPFGIGVALVLSACGVTGGPGIKSLHAPPIETDPSDVSGGGGVDPSVDGRGEPGVEASVGAVSVLCGAPFASAQAICWRHSPCPSKSQQTSPDVQSESVPHGGCARTMSGTDEQSEQVRGHSNFTALPPVAVIDPWANGADVDVAVMASELPVSIQAQ